MNIVIFDSFGFMFRIYLGTSRRPTIGLRTREIVQEVPIQPHDLTYDDEQCMH